MAQERKRNRSKEKEDRQDRQEDQAPQGSGQDQSQSWRKAQVRFLRWAKTRRVVACYMQMRMGKTLAMVRWIWTRPGARLCLVLAPYSAIPSWVKECERLKVNYLVLTGKDKVQERRVKLRDAVLSGKKVLVISNYESLISPDSHFSEAIWGWDLVCLDESTKIKNPKARITKAILKVFKDVPFRAVMSGNPSPESIEEFVPQLLFLNGTCCGFKTYWAWRHRCTAKVSAYTTVTKRWARQQIENELADCAWFDSRKRSGEPTVEKRRQVEWVLLPETTQSYLQRCEREFIAKNDKLAMNKLEVVTWLSRITGGLDVSTTESQHTAKLNRVREIVEERGVPCIIWARFNDEISKIAESLTVWGFRVAKATGKHRDGVQRFVSGEVQVLVCQAAAISLGVDLSKAKYAIVYSSWWSGEMNQQLEDRIIAMGKDGYKDIVHILARDTIDEDIFRALTKKDRQAEGIVNRVLANMKGRHNGN